MIGSGPRKIRDRRKAGFHRLKNSEQNSGSPRRPAHPVKKQDQALRLKTLLRPVSRKIRYALIQLKRHAPFWLRQIRQDLRHDSRQAVQSIRRVGQERVYRLKGYTTVAKINRKRQAERQQRLLRRLLFFFFALLLAVLLANIYNPIQDLSEWYRIIGIRHLNG